MGHVIWFWLTFFLIGGFRLWVAVTLLLSGSVGAASYGISELMAVWLGYGNLRERRFSSTGVVAYIVPLCYGAAFFVRPTGSQPGWLAVPLGLLLAMSYLSLGNRYTFGVPTWASLKDDGLYAVVRHPLIALVMLTRLVLTMTFGGLWNWTAFGLCLIFLVIEIRAEETFLRTVPEWRAYSERVRWRLIPGVV